MVACDTDGSEFGPIELPRGLKPVGPSITNGTLLQSIATALHVNNAQVITGQTSDGVHLQPNQPLMAHTLVSDEDISRQEERVVNARKKLQEALCT